MTTVPHIDIGTLVLQAEQEFKLSPGETIARLLDEHKNDPIIYKSLLSYVQLGWDNATYDPIVKRAFTRGHYDSIADRIVDHARSYGGTQAYLFFDLDHFKLVNDCYGHDAGDAALRAFGDAAYDTLHERPQRHTSTLIRYGGDEFLVILDGATREEAVEVAEHLRHRFHDVTARQPYGRLTFSAGIALYDEDGGDAKTLCAIADKRAYAAKHAGRNRTYANDGPRPARLLDNIAVATR